MTNSIKDIEGSNFILVIGSNTTEAHPVIGMKIKKAMQKGATLVVVDPRQTHIAKQSNNHLRIKPGTDIALLNAMAHVIIKENLLNKGFVSTCTKDYPVLVKAVEKYTPEYAEQITGIPANDIREVARGYATAKSAVIAYTMGITQHETGTKNVLAIANLALLCGHIGKENCGVSPLRGQNNVQGACDMGALPNAFPGYQSLESAKDKFRKAWNADVPSAPGLTSIDMIDKAAAGELKSMYIVGENPVVADANTNHTIKALKSLDFLVVQDIFLTETAKLADVVLPAASFVEKEGTFTNTERKVQLVQQVIKPIGSAKQDWQIICELSRRLDYSMDYNSPEQIMNEISTLVPIYGGIAHERLKDKGLQWPCPTKEHSGTPVLYTDNFIGKFHAVELQPKECEGFILNTGRSLFHFNTGTMTSRVDALQKIHSENSLEINPKDAEALDVRTGDDVSIVSNGGALVLKAKITDATPAGSVFSCFHLEDKLINMLTDSLYDSSAKTPQYKVVKVNLTKTISSVETLVQEEKLSCNY